MWDKIIGGAMDLIGIGSAYDDAFGSSPEEDAASGAGNRSAYDVYTNLNQTKGGTYTDKFQGYIAWKYDVYDVNNEGPSGDVLQQEVQNFNPDNYEFGSKAQFGHSDYMPVISESSSGSEEGVSSDVENTDWAIGWNNQTEGTNMTALIGTLALVYAGYKIVKEVF